MWRRCRTLTAFEKPWHFLKVGGGEERMRSEGSKEKEFPGGFQHRMPIEHIWGALKIILMSGK